MNKSNLILIVAILQITGATKISYAQYIVRNEMNYRSGGINPDKIIFDSVDKQQNEAKGNNILYYSQTKVRNCNPPPIILAMSTRTAICKGETSTLTAIGGVTYTWNPGGPGTSIVVSPSVFTTYTVTGTDVNSCTNTAVIQIKVAALPSLYITSTNSLICAGESSTLTAGGPYTFTWSSAQNGSLIVVSPSVTTNYTVTASNGCLNSFFYTQNVDACTFTDQNLIVKQEYMVFPNPNNGKFQIGTEDSELREVEIYTARGEIIYHKVSIKSLFVVDISSFQNGIYFLKIVDENSKVLNRKIVVQ